MLFANDVVLMDENRLELIISHNYRVYLNLRLRLVFCQAILKGNLDCQQCRLQVMSIIVFGTCR